MWGLAGWRGRNQQGLGSKSGHGWSWAGARVGWGCLWWNSQSSFDCVRWLLWEVLRSQTWGSRDDMCWNWPPPLGTGWKCWALGFNRLLVIEQEEHTQCYRIFQVEGVGDSGEAPTRAKADGGRQGAAVWVNMGSAPCTSCHPPPPTSVSSVRIPGSHRKRCWPCPPLKGAEQDRGQAQSSAGFPALHCPPRKSPGVPRAGWSGASPSGTPSWPLTLCQGLGVAHR